MIAICHLLSLFRERNRKTERARVMLDESTLQLAQTNMDLQEHAVLAEQRAAESERRRLAREVHDVLAYTLTSLIMMMEAAIDLAGQQEGPLRQHLERIRDQTKEGVLEVRRTLQAIRTRRADARDRPEGDLPGWCSRSTRRPTSASGSTSATRP